MGFMFIGQSEGVSIDQMLKPLECDGRVKNVCTRRRDAPVVLKQARSIRGRALDERGEAYHQWQMTVRVEPSPADGDHERRLRGDAVRGKRGDRARDRRNVPSQFDRRLRDAIRVRHVDSERVRIQRGAVSTESVGGQHEIGRRRAIDREEARGVEVD
eukprot:23112-Pelagococcus_subviridis.AAC.1